MNQHRSLPALFVLVAAAALALAGCGSPKRPPVLTTPGDQAPASPGAGSETTERLPPGPDLRPLDSDFPTGEDFPVSDPSGEGGPLADIHFEFDRANLTDEARAILERHALWLQNHRGAKVAVEGHCDERGTVEYNLALGEQRARVAREYLVSLGVAPERLRTVSYGKERPLDPTTSEEAWAKNRRCHFAVTR